MPSYPYFLDYAFWIKSRTVSELQEHWFSKYQTQYGVLFASVVVLRKHYVELRVAQVIHVFQYATVSFQSWTTGGLNQGLKSILKAIQDNPGIQAIKVSALLNNRPIKTNEKQIKALVEKRLIERKGSKKTGGYYIK